MYHPLLVFDGDTGQLITAVLRPGNAHAGKGALAVLKRLVRALRARWPGVAVACAPNAASPHPPCTSTASRSTSTTPSAWSQTPVWRRSPAAPGRGDGEARADRGGEGAAHRRGQLLGRLLVGRAARRLQGGGAMQEPQHPLRRHQPPGCAPGALRLVRRSGRPELWIKDYKRACKADRLSDHRFLANQFRLFSHAAAYWLLDTLRLQALKIGGRIYQLLTRVRLALTSGHPGQPLWSLLAASPSSRMHNPG
jgi:hypothetical protein